MSDPQQGAEPAAPAAATPTGHASHTTAFVAPTPVGSRTMTPPLCTAPKGTVQTRRATVPADQTAAQAQQWTMRTAAAQTSGSPDDLQDGDIHAGSIPPRHSNSSGDVVDPMEYVDHDADMIGSAPPKRIIVRRASKSPVKIRVIRKGAASIPAHPVSQANLEFSTASLGVEDPNASQSMPARSTAEEALAAAMAAAGDMDDSSSDTSDAVDKATMDLLQAPTEMPSETTAHDETTATQDAHLHAAVEDVLQTHTQQATEPTVQDERSSMPTSFKLSDEDLDNARKRREEEIAREEQYRKEQAAKIRAAFDRAVAVMSFVGHKGHVFEAGANARVRVEAAMKHAEAAAEQLSKSPPTPSPDMSADERRDMARENLMVGLKGFASSAARRISSVFGSAWNETVAPAVRNTIPDDYKNDINTTSINTAAMTVGVALLLLPAFQMGVMDEELAAVENDVPGQQIAYEHRASTPRDPNPAVSQASATAMTEISSPFPQVEAPSFFSKLFGRKAAEPPREVVLTEEEIVEKLAAIAPKPGTPVTTDTALNVIKVSLGQRAKLAERVTFDSLAVEPTVVLEVSKSFRNLRPSEQRSFASAVLRGTRAFNYESVSIVEAGTDIEFAHAGIDIDLADETASLRRQLKAAQNKADALAVQLAASETEVDAMNIRLGEQKDGLISEKNNFAAQLKGERIAIAELTEELQEARLELAEMPDRKVLEQRTLEAEDMTRRMESTLEILGRQVTVARDSEQAAEKEAKTAKDALVNLEKEKNAALAKAAKDAETAIAKAESVAEQKIAALKKEAASELELVRAEATKAQKLAEEVRADRDRRVDEIKVAMDKALETEAKARTDALASAKADSDSQLALVMKEQDEKIRGILEKSSADVAAAQKAATAAETARAGSEKAAAKEIADLRKSFEKAAADDNTSRDKLLADTIKAKDAEIKQVEETLTAKYEKLFDDLKKRSADEINAVVAASKADRQALAAAQADAKKQTAEFAKEKDAMLGRIGALEGRLKDMEARASGAVATKVATR